MQIVLHVEIQPLISVVTAHALLIRMKSLPSVAQSMYIIYDLACKGSISVSSLHHDNEQRNSKESFYLLHKHMSFPLSIFFELVVIV